MKEDAETKDVSMTSILDWLINSFGFADEQALILPALQAALVLGLALTLTYLLRRAISRHMSIGQGDDGIQIARYKSIATYSVMIPAILICIHMLGIDLTPLFATGGVFALALGFGMKTLAENFISGVILRFEKIAKPGDVLVLNGDMMTVISVGLRATTTDAYDGQEIVIANSDLLQSRIGTFSLSDANYRIKVGFQIGYDVDHHKVQSLLQDALAGLDCIAKGTKPLIILSDLRAELVNFDVYIWVESPGEGLSGRTKLNLAICQTLLDIGIEFSGPLRKVVLENSNSSARATASDTGAT